MPDVYLNHLLVFVDRETYGTIAASGFLNEHFACSEERTTYDQATGMSWTGRYYYGRRTYFEFMNPDKTSWAPRDALAFSIEAEGGSEALARRLEQELDLKVRLFKRNRRYQARDIPWFWTVEIPREDDARLISWVMEYDPAFLDNWAPELPPGTAASEPAARESVGTEPAGITRSAFLTRYRSAIGDDLPKRLFRDITSVTVTLPPDEADLLEDELRIYGYITTETDGSSDLEAGKEADSASAGTAANPAGTEPAAIGKRVKYQGPDFDIVVERASGDDDRTRSRDSGSIGGVCGISAFTMETQPVSVTTTHTFGPACRLTVHKTGKATWSFRP